MISGTIQILLFCNKTFSSGYLCSFNLPGTLSEALPNNPDP
jgi:hypothetical protein